MKVRSSVDVRHSFYLYKKNECVICDMWPIHLDRSVWGSWIFSMVVFFGFHCDSTGLAAANTAVRALSWQIIPAYRREKRKKTDTHGVRHGVRMLGVSSHVRGWGVLNTPWQWRGSAAPWPHAAQTACCRSSCQIRQCSRCRCRSAPVLRSAGPPAWFPGPSSRRRWDPRRWSPSLTCTGHGAPGCTRTAAAGTCWYQGLRRAGCSHLHESDRGRSGWSLCECHQTTAAGFPGMKNRRNKH